MHTITVTLSSVLGASRSHFALEIPEGSRLGDALQEIYSVSGIPADIVQKKPLLYVVNGHNSNYLDGVDTILGDGDFVRILPVLGGG